MLYKVCWLISVLSSSVSVEPGSALPSGKPRGLVRGGAALGVDPAAAASSPGGELHWYQALTLEEEPRGALGLSGVVPLGSLRLLGGVEWNTLGEVGVRRQSVGAGLEVAEAFYLGGVYRKLEALDESFEETGSVDLGAYSQPTSWLSWSAGVLGVNRPVVNGVGWSPTYTGGLGLKPASWLRVGADLSWRGINTGDSQGDRMGFRAGVEIEPLAGLMFTSTFERLGDRDSVWLGASIESSGLALGGRAGSRAGTPMGVWEVAFQTKPPDSFLRAREREVGFNLSGDLAAEKESWWGSKSSLSTLALEFEELASDSGVDVVYLRIGEIAISLADVSALRRGIRKLRASGKRVEAYLSNVEEKGYLLACAADVIFMDPMGQITLDGFSIKRRYWAEFLSKIGVRFEAVAVGAYKTGADFLTRASSRAEEQETLDRLLDQAYRTLREGVARDRNLSDEQLEAILVEGQFGAARAKELGLVDELTGELNEVPRQIPSGMTFSDNRRVSTDWGPSKKMAVIPVIGTLVGAQRVNPFGGKSVRVHRVLEALKEARERDDIVGAVLRVESPGGEVLAAEAIWREVRRLVSEKPVVVSMGAVAASGGYYLSAPATRIFVEADTVTGSIGIFALRPDFSGIYEKSGVRNEVSVRGVHADVENLDEPLDEPGRKRLERSLQLYYQAFVAKVADGRKLPLPKAFELAEGRVYSGVEALKVGLADELGGVVEALGALRELSGETRELDILILGESQSFDAAVGLSGLVRSPKTVRDTFMSWADNLSQWDNRALALLPIAYEVSP